MSWSKKSEFTSNRRNKVLDDPVLGVWNGGLMSVDIAAGFDRRKVRVPTYFIVEAESSSA